jgi:GTP-binding protein
MTKYGHGLAGKERWLVLNKTDLLDPGELDERRRRLLVDLDWDAPVYAISALTGAGTDRLVGALMARLEALRAAGASPPEPGEDQAWHPLDP